MAVDSYFSRAKRCATADDQRSSSENAVAIERRITCTLSRRCLSRINIFLFDRWIARPGSAQACTETLDQQRSQVADTAGPVYQASTWFDARRFQGSVFDRAGLAIARAKYTISQVPRATESPSESASRLFATSESGSDHAT